MEEYAHNDPRRQRRSRRCEGMVLHGPLAATSQYSESLLRWFPSNKLLSEHPNRLKLWKICEKV